MIGWVGRYLCRSGRHQRLPVGPYSILGHEPRRLVVCARQCGWYAEERVPVEEWVAWNTPELVVCGCTSGDRWAVGLNVCSACHHHHGALLCEAETLTYPAQEATDWRYVDGGIVLLDSNVPAAYRGRPLAHGRVNR